MPNWQSLAVKTGAKVAEKVADKATEVKDKLTSNS